MTNVFTEIDKSIDNKLNFGIGATHKRYVLPKNIGSTAYLIGKAVQWSKDSKVLYIAPKFEHHNILEHVNIYVDVVDFMDIIKSSSYMAKLVNREYDYVIVDNFPYPDGFLEMMSVLSVKIVIQIDRI